ncbi:putative cyclic nucleotide-gated ion channel 12 [Cardamine amara subsp. amara]|uniref:Cyclic nucleotide-gated ion channel 12 n=1 Tax=Cardamine amara subsp. amara TaxID=228776 RepID=A0ABD0ZA68_CARAN
MNIQKSSSARSDTGNRERYVNGNGVKGCIKKVYRKMKTLENWKKVYGKMKPLENWNKTLMSACVVALAIDPLFLFIPEINAENSCFSFDKNLGKTVCVLRTFIDTFYMIHVIVCFIKEVIDYLDRSQTPLRGESSEHSKAVRKIRLPLYFLIVDIVSVLPIPQVVFLSIIVRSSTKVLVSRRILISFTKWIIVCQCIPRIIRIHPLYKEVTRTSGTIAESNWIGAALNLFLFMLFSYVFGAFWYVSAIDKKVKCWYEVCGRTSGCKTKNLFCHNVDNSRFLKTSCPVTDPDKITNTTEVFNFGMFIDALKSGVVEIHPRDFPRKFVYCFWWGLRNLSTFATDLEPGESTTDILFAIIICASGLILFAVLIGNVQKYLISTTVRVEEMMERKRDTEKWMSSRGLPEELKKRIRKYDTYKWRAFRGTEENSLLRSLPKDLRLETKRHLYKNLLKRVPFLENMNEWLLEAVCDRVKSVFYSANSCILREGDPIEEMLIVTKGLLECRTKSGDHYRVLKEGDVCGDLHFWIFNPNHPPDLPTSTKTVKTLNIVEGFILLPDDLKFVASHLDLNVQCSSSSEPHKSAVPEISKD